LDQRSYRRYWWISKRVALAKANKECIDRLSWECGWRLGEIWRKDIHIDLGSDQTSLHNPYGGYYPTDISFEDANAMMAENPILFKEYRKHYAVTPPLSINTQQKEPISLIMEMRFY
jgi:hypothetical protein